MSPPEPTAAGAIAVAETALAQERHQDAFARFRRVLAADPDNPRARLGVAEVFLATGSLKEALAIFGALTASPEVAVAAKEGRGLCLLAMGEGDKAVEALSDAVAQDPSRWRAWNALGRIHDQRRAWEEAGRAYENAIAIAPKTPALYSNRGMSLLAQGNAVGAAAEFRKALSLDPNFEVARNNLRLALAFEGKYRDALAGVEERHLPLILNNVGYAALLRGDYDKAETYFVRALETSPHFYAVAWNNLNYLDSMRSGTQPDSRLSQPSLDGAR